MSKISYWFRWVAVLPASFIVMNVCLGIWGQGNYANNLFFYPATFLIYAFAGGAFVYIGEKVAPNKKKITAIILIALLFIQSFFILLFVGRGLIVIVRIIAMLLGSVAYFIFFKDQDV